MFLLQETIKTRGVHVGARFAPTAPLDKQHKQQFQIKCSEGFDWRRQEYAEHAWQMTSPQAEGDPRSQLKLTVTTDSVNFEDFFPTSTLDVYFDNLRMAFGVVGTVFNPRIMLSTGAMIRLTAQTEENDGRIFLGQRCLRLDNRLGPLGRPVHAVGLKLVLPPLPGADQPNWQAELKIESLIEDVRQVFIEIDARWAQPCPWDPETVVQRGRTVYEFLTTRVIEMLREMSQPG